MRISSGTCSILNKAGFLPFISLSCSQLDQPGLAFAWKSSRYCGCLGSRVVCAGYSLWVLLELREGQKWQDLGFSLGVHLAVYDSTAGHLWIPQGEAGRQSLLWVFLSTLEKCVFFWGPWFYCNRQHWLELQSGIYFKVHLKQSCFSCVWDGKFKITLQNWSVSVKEIASTVKQLSCLCFLKCQNSCSKRTFCGLLYFCSLLLMKDLHDFYGVVTELFQF